MKIKRSAGSAHQLCCPWKSYGAFGDITPLKSFLKNRFSGNKTLKLLSSDSLFSKTISKSKNMVWFNSTCVEDGRLLDGREI